MLATQSRRAAQTAARSARRGFTLVELLVVVGMIGILAALAIVGYRKYQHSAQSGEARAVLQGIRGAQEAYRAETLTYLDCAPDGLMAGLHPRSQDDLDNKKAHFKGWGGTVQACFDQLNVQTDGPVRFSYAVTAGPPGVDPNTAAVTEMADFPTFATPAPEPWYVALAVGDRDDDDSSFAFLLATSYTGEIYAENDSE